MKELVKNIDKKLRLILTFNFGLILLEFIYLLRRIKYLNDLIPFWMTLPWGVEQLAPKILIFLLPLLSFVILLLGIFFISNAAIRIQRHGPAILTTIVTVTNLLLGYSVLRILNVTSSVFDPLFDPRLSQIFIPGLFAFMVSYFVAPWFINKFKEKGIITDPSIHKHPGMLLSKPSARGGGVIFIFGVLITSVLFLKATPMVIGILAAALLAALLGYLDDIQNTSSTKFSWLENPVIRALLQIGVTLPLIFSGVIVRSINNPFNGMMFLDSWTLTFGGIELAPIAVIFTIVWVIWIMNLLSWSNGVDGQYSGTIGVVGIIVAIITLRLLHFDSTQKDMMELAAIVAGASIGLLPYGWYPSKLMWGFGAISAGIILAAISVVSQAKIATSIIVLTVPFLDGAITVGRRLVAKQSPFKGDKGHLHHLLLERGWSVKRIAVFYWITTALFGLAALSAADKDPILTALTGLGVVAFAIISLNINSKK